jgi:large subunit ribosomal protein L23
MDGMADRKYAFKVLKSATKPEIANAVETMFKGVKVADVNTINMKSKPKRLGVHAGRTATWKKAIVTLTADSKPIEFFEGLN